MKKLGILILLASLNAHALMSAGAATAKTIENASCIAVIQKADQLIQTQGGDAVSAQAALSALNICKTELTQKEAYAFLTYEAKCHESYSMDQGTASQAMLAVCQMNAIRYVLSLQLDLNQQ